MPSGASEVSRRVRECLLQCARHACRAASLRSCSRSPPPASYRITTLPHRPGVASRGEERLLLERSSVAAEPAEDGERDCRASTSQTSSPPGSTSPCSRGRELLGLLARRGAGDHVRPAPHDAVALRLEPVGELARLAVRARTGSAPPTARSRPRASPPRSCRRAGSLSQRSSSSSQCSETISRGSSSSSRDLRVDRRPRLLELRRRARVDEDRVLVVADREPLGLELVGEVARRRRVEQPRRAARRRALVELDPQPPVVVRHGRTVPPRSAVREVRRRLARRRGRRARTARCSCRAGAAPSVGAVHRVRRRPLVAGRHRRRPGARPCCPRRLHCAL